MRRGLRRRAITAILGFLSTGLTAVGGYWLWYTNRAPPPPLRRTIAPGFEYERFVVDGPAVVHLLEVALTPDLVWLGTPKDTSGGRQTIAQTTSEFLEAAGATVAINTSFFAPWHSNTLLDYYPHTGDPVDCIGVTITDGVRLGPYDPNLTSLWVLPDGRAIVDGADHPDARFAYSGFALITTGTVAPPSKGTAYGSRHPRTAAAVTRDGRRLLLVVVDGRQPGYSEGMAVEPLARLLLERGGHDAVLFDGGGSSTMVVREGDSATVLNTPVHGRHPPGIERPVACNLGLKR